jgi:hypothetical protein
MLQRGCASEGDHAKIAERFQSMCNAFDAIKESYKRCVPAHAKTDDYPAMKPGESYLLTQLKNSVAKWNLPGKYSTRTGKLHKVMKKQGNDGRRSLPSALRDHLILSTNFKQEKVEAKWLVCYLNNIHPDQNSPDWVYFECSHLCIEHGLGKNVCIDPGCLFWESKAINQGRGNTFCTKKCVHEGCTKTLCECQKLHNPCCH